MKRAIVYKIKIKPLVETKGDLRLMVSDYYL